MSDVIHLLPDSVANQIAAGEVVQRPASVVKELMENSIDAGASKIQVRVRDAGKSEIQIVDNGVGMSDTDARLAFERHATSKIQTSKDLFSISTMGFRGEALASVAAVAQIELHTRQQGDELGTILFIEGSKITSQEPDVCPIGANFIIRNLFYNTPARRKFLKSNATELNNVIVEFEKIALCHIDKSLELYNGDQLLIALSPSSFKLRIVNLFGKKLDDFLIPVEANTSIVRISGFVTTPEGAKKKKPYQFFYVNGRYMRNSYFNKAVQSAYERLITESEQAQFFLKLEVDPSKIDVNIHPTKTEIKFEDDNAIWQILSASVREALGKFNAIPALDFDRKGCPDIPVGGENVSILSPQVHIDGAYNPFSSEQSKNKSVQNWQKMYNSLSPSGAMTLPLEKVRNDELNFSFTSSSDDKLEIGNLCNTMFFQFANHYVVCPQKNQLIFIDQHRAHYRVLYDQYMDQLKVHRGVSQGLLFPELIHLTAKQETAFLKIKDELSILGFDFSNMGNGAYSINGVPDGTAEISPQVLVDNILADDHLIVGGTTEKLYHTIANRLALQSAITVGRELSNDEMKMLISNLLATSNYRYTPNGKSIIYIMNPSQVDKGFI